MGPGPTDLVGSHLDGANLLQISTIPATTSSLDLLQRILDHEKTGTPLVITGVDCDPHWHSQYSRPPGNSAQVDHGTEENDASAIFTWLESLSIIPGHLLSRGEDTVFPPVIKDLKRERGGQGRPFQQNHCGSVLQHLTIDLPDGSSDIWFVSAASSVQQVTSHPLTSTNDLSLTILTTSELSSCPFPIYTHRQSVGDLLVLPPSCYGQNLRERDGCSISWSRINIRSMELSVYCALPMYRRVCRPERYEIRQTIHAALVSHTTAVDQFISHPADAAFHQEFPLAGIARDLSTLIQLFDEILQEDYCDDHGSLNSDDSQQRPLTCSYCGSCLFLSCFSCRRGCSQETNAPILVCTGCYTEGRSCRCDTMDPIRLGDFSSALQDRNSAVSSLLKASNLHHVPTEDLVEVSEDSFMWPRIALFKAAKELWRLKNSPDLEKKGKTCTPRGGNPSHPAPPTSLVNCKKCHGAKCFMHILQGSVHASEALLSNAADPGSVFWHKRHKEALERKALPLANLPLAHELDVLNRRVFFVQHFSSTSPLEPGMCVGFYDAPFPNTPLPSVELPSNCGTTTSIGIHPEPSAPIPLSRTSSRSTVTLATDTEAPTVEGRRTLRTREQANAGLDPGPSGRNPKRARSPESEGSGDDDEYIPPKRARLSRSSTRIIRATHSISSAAGAPDLPPPPHQPAAGLIPGRLSPVTKQPSGPGVVPPPSQPVDSQSLRQSSVGQTALQQPTRTASVETPPLVASSSATGPPDAEPAAWKFFNPLTDMEDPAQPVGPPTMAGIAPTDRPGIEHLYGITSASPVQNPFPQSTFTGLGPLFSRARLNETGPSLLHELPRAEGSSSSSNTPSAVEYPTTQSPVATGNTWSHQQPFRRRLERQSSLLRPPTSPTNSRSSITTTTSTSATLRRRDSREDTEARRALETVKGDSLSRENLATYIDILRNFEALEE